MYVYKRDEINHTVWRCNGTNSANLSNDCHKEPNTRLCGCRGCHAMKTKVTRIFMGLRNIRWRAYPHVPGPLSTNSRWTKAHLYSSCVGTCCLRGTFPRGLSQTIRNPAVALRVDHPHPLFVKTHLRSKALSVSTLPYCAIAWLTPHGFNGLRNFYDSFMSIKCGNY